MSRNIKAEQRYRLSRITLFGAVVCYGAAIYFKDGTLHKDLVILGLMMFAVFELLTPRPALFTTKESDGTQTRKESR